VLYRAVDVAGNVERTNRAVLPAAGVVLAPSTTKATLSATKIPYGSSGVVTVTVSGKLAQRPSGTVRVLLGDASVGFGTLSGGKVTIRLAKTIGPGDRVLKVVYSGDEQYAGSSATVTLKVVAATSKTTVSVKPATVKAGKKVHLTAKVTSSTGVTASGWVRVVAVNGPSKIVRTVRLGADGEVSFDFGPLSRKGTYQITVAYQGSSTVSASISPVRKVKVN